jgi:cytochrome P450
VSFPLGDQVTVEQLTLDSHPVLAMLRETEPVSWLPALSGWLVTRHDLARQVMREDELFTVDDPRFSTAQVVGPSMLSLDGRAHSRHRGPFASAFRPAQVRGRFAPFVEETVARLIERIRPAGTAELRRELAGPLSVAVIAESLGMADADPGMIMDWYAAIVAGVSAISAGQPLPDEAGSAFAQLQKAVRQDLACPAADSMLAAAAMPPYELAVTEIVSNAAVLMFGGIDTTEGMIANLVVHALTEPARWQILLLDPGLIPVAVEESLRLEPTAAVVDRYATADTELAGARIAAGDLVIVSIAGANRDPAVFTEPNEFRLDRTNLRLQLAFATGPHFCLGMDLARLQARTVLTQLLDALPGLRLDPDHPSPARGLVFRKPTEVRVRWDPTE